MMKGVLKAGWGICAYKIEESRGIGFNKNKSIEKLRKARMPKSFQMIYPTQLSRSLNNVDYIK